MLPCESLRLIIMAINGSFDKEKLDAEMRKVVIVVQYNNKKDKIELDIDELSQITSNQIE